AAGVCGLVLGARRRALPSRRGGGGPRSRTGRRRRRPAVGPQRARRGWQCGRRGRRTPARWRSSRFRAGPCPVGRWPSAALKAGRRSAASLAALETVETAIAALRAQLVALEQVGAPILPAVHPEWVRARLAELEALLREDPIRSRTEIMKHLDGDLTVTRSP